jgi:hypothetical protein
MRRASLTALGIAAYLVMLVATAPASFVAARLLRIDGVMLQDARGTIWNGAAHARLALPGGTLELQELSWRFKPARLLAGRIAFEIAVHDARIDARGELARALGGMEAREVQARADAAVASMASPLLANWLPQGRLSLTAPLLAWDERELRGNARAEWRDAVLSLPEPRALGTYVAQLQGEGGPAKLTLSTPQGALRLAAEGTFAPPARIVLKGDARAQGPGAESLEPLLNMIGPRRADGARGIDWRTP